MHPERAILREKIAFLMLCYLVYGVPAYASTADAANSGGVDTPSGVTSLPLAAEGQVGITVQADTSGAATPNPTVVIPSVSSAISAQTTSQTAAMNGQTTATTNGDAAIVNALHAQTVALSNQASAFTKMSENSKNARFQLSCVPSTNPGQYIGETIPECYLLDTRTGAVYTANYPQQGAGSSGKQGAWTQSIAGNARTIEGADTDLCLLTNSMGDYYYLANHDPSVGMMSDPATPVVTVGTTVVTNLSGTYNTTNGSQSFYAATVCYYTCQSGGNFQLSGFGAPQQSLLTYANSSSTGFGNSGIGPHFTQLSPTSLENFQGMIISNLQCSPP